MSQSKENTHNYSSWLDLWLSLKKTRVKESSYTRYYNAVNNHIKPYLGHYEIEKISTSIMEHYVSTLIDSGRKQKTGGLSVKSVSDILAIVKSTFRYAESYEISTICCFDYITLKKDVKEMRVLSKYEEKRLSIHLCKDMDRYKLGVFIAMYTGIRIGELCALQWKDISLEEKTLKITKTVQRMQKLKEESSTKTHLVITQPKSQTSIRNIPLSEAIVNVLLRFESKPDCFILSNSSFKLIEPRTMQNHFKRYLSETSINYANFHSLRHTFATRCIEAGFDIKCLSEILGHASVTITLDKYVHSSLEQKRRNMNKLPIYTE